MGRMGIALSMLLAGWNGVISTVAGSGTCTLCCLAGHGSDGGLATADARPGGPQAVALDELGNLYIEDTVGEVAADAAGVVDGSGLATTICGTAPAAIRRPSPAASRGSPSSMPPTSRLSTRAPACSSIWSVC